MANNTEIGDRRFLEAAVVAGSLQRIARSGRANPNEVAFLIARTPESQHYIADRVISDLLTGVLSTSSPLLTFILREVLYRQQRTEDNELERRLAFMELFSGLQGFNIVGRITEIHSSCAEAGLLIAQVSTRTFLERLYLLMTSVKDVLEARLSICDWLIASMAEPEGSLEEERNALARELENLEARSDLDSTRVHVDEESLREWFNDTQREAVTRYFQTSYSEGSNVEFGSLLAFYSNRDRNKSDQEEDFSSQTQIGSEFLLVEIFDATFKTFSSHRTFGLDAYLSRRIRHGSLSGHLITPVVRILNRLCEFGASVGGDFSGQTAGLAEDWRKFLTLELDRVRREIIQLRTTEHPKGLIQAEWRTVPNIVHIDAMIGRIKAQSLDRNTSYDVFSDMFPLCWDCIEPDLAQLRHYMMREFFPTAVENLFQLRDNLAPQHQRLLQEFISELYDSLEARVRDICGWFIRPVFRRDSYDFRTLANSIMSTVRELDDNYRFLEEVTTDSQIILNRGSFIVFGDILFVLVGNAAKHGRPDGLISISAEHLRQRSDLVSIKITSEVLSSAEHEAAVDRIRDALTVKEQQIIHKAAVEEGFSGLRKLVGLWQRFRSPDVRLMMYPTVDKLQITFWLTLPVEITVARDVG